MGYRGDWAILPATMELYGRKTVTVVEAAAEWQPAADTILICSKERPDGRRRFCFVSSAGDCFTSWRSEIGKTFSTFHDQTGVSKGNYRLENVVVVKNHAMIKNANMVGLTAKASLSVFK